MGTSALIKNKDTNIELYKHYDGYPSGVSSNIINAVNLDSTDADDNAHSILKKIEETPLFNLLIAAAPREFSIETASNIGVNHQYDLDAKNGLITTDDTHSQEIHLFANEAYLKSSASIVRRYMLDVKLPTPSDCISKEHAKHCFDEFTSLANEMVIKVSGNLDADSYPYNPPAPFFVGGLLVDKYKNALSEQLECYKEGNPNRDNVKLKLQDLEQGMIEAQKFKAKIADLIDTYQVLFK